MERQNDVTSFSELYRRYAGDVYRFALGLSGRRQEAEDITSEAFLRLWSSSAPIRAATVRAYLFAIARNLFLESLRRRRREEVLDIDVASAEDVAGGYEARRQWTELRRAMAELTEEDRAALILHAWMGVPYEEISETLQMPVATLKVRVHRARNQLASAIERERIR